MPQRSIRFPDELAAWIEDEATRLDRSFSWLVLRALAREKDRAESNSRARTPAAPVTSTLPASLRGEPACEPGGRLAAPHRPTCKCAVCKPPRDLMKELKASLESARKPKAKKP